MARGSRLTRGVRLGAAVLAGGMVTTGALAGTMAGRAAAAVDPGVGSSYAQGFQVTPHEGSLAVGGVFDEALAGHTDKIARAQSQGLDLGSVGASIKGYNCGQPPSALAKFVPDPLQAETPSNGGTAQASAGPAVNDNNADGSTEHVLANGTPYGEAQTIFGGQLAVPGNVLSVSHVASKAWSGLVNGARVAAATVDIGSLVIAGQVTLSGLHWQVAYPSGPGAGQPTSEFKIGKVTVAGQSLPTNDLSAVGDAINKVLGSLGIEVVFPTVTNAQGIQFVAPLQIEVIPSDTRDNLLDPVITGGFEKNWYPIANGLENGFANTSAPYNALAPTEQGAPGSPQQQLQAALCQSDTPITVADVTIASFTRGGYFNIALGGVNASSGNLPSNPFNLNMFSPFSLPGSTQVIPGTPGSAALAGSAGSAVPTQIGATAAPASSLSQSGTGATQAAPQPAPAATTPAASIARAASGPLLAVGLAILGLLLVLAEADRRLIRRTASVAVFEE